MPDLSRLFIDGWNPNFLLENIPQVLAIVFVIFLGQFFMFLRSGLFLKNLGLLPIILFFSLDDSCENQKNVHYVKLSISFEWFDVIRIMDIGFVCLLQKVTSQGHVSAMLTCKLLHLRRLIFQCHKKFPKLKDQLFHRIKGH